MSRKLLNKLDLGGIGVLPESNELILFLGRDLLHPYQTLLEYLQLEKTEMRVSYPILAKVWAIGILMK
jgi:hypothetical protein